MRKSKRLVSVFMIMISLVCAIGMFAGCKKSKADGDDDKTGKPAVAVELTAEMITLEYSTAFYDRNEKKPDVTIKVGEYVVEKSEYTVSYSNNIEIGTATATVSAKEGSGVLKGSASKNFTILIGQLAEIEPMGDALYSEQDDTLQECIGRMLVANGKTLSAAESCTGGTISALLTGVPGSSEYYLGSVTSYANSVKTGVLGVDPEIIAKYGAVSSECVAQMAEGVRKLTGSDFAVATSGIAGPGGGSDEKPVGLVWIAVSSEKGTETRKMVFRVDRKRNIERFASSALDTLRRKLINELNY